MHEQLELECEAEHARAIAVVVKASKANNLLLNIVCRHSGVVSFGDGYQVGKAFSDDSIDAVANLLGGTAIELVGENGVINVVVVDSLR